MKNWPIGSVVRTPTLSPMGSVFIHEAQLKQSYNQLYVVQERFAKLHARQLIISL